MNHDRIGSESEKKSGEKEQKKDAELACLVGTLGGKLTSLLWGLESESVERGHYSPSPHVAGQNWLKPGGGCKQRRATFARTQRPSQMQSLFKVNAN